MASATVLLKKAFPTSIYLEQSNGFIVVEFTSKDLQTLRLECPGELFGQLSLARVDLDYDIEIKITER